MSPKEEICQRKFTIEGVELGYPTHFYDGSSMMGLFSVPTREANAIIAGSGFQVAEMAPGRAMLSIICVHYTDTQCGSYEEIALAFFVQPTGHQRRRSIPWLSNWWHLLRGSIASYTWCLPVSTTLARDCGIQMWGFPKTLERIEWKHSNGRARATWTVDGEPALSFSVRASGTRSSGPIAPPVYSLFEGKPHVSYLEQTYKESGKKGRDGLLELGSHPVADKLRRLGLPKKPLLTVWNGKLTFAMTHPEPLV